MAAEWIDFKKQKPPQKGNYLYCREGIISWYFWDGKEFWDYGSDLLSSCHNPDYWMDLVVPHYHKLTWINTEGIGRIGTCSCGYEEIVTHENIVRKERISEYIYHANQADLKIGV